MRIGDLAKQAGVSARSLRHYESVGLLDPSRGAQGYREYSESDVGRVAAIRSLMDSGIALSVIVDLMGCVDGSQVKPCPKVLDAYRQHLARVDAAIGRLSQTRRVLEDVLSQHGQQSG